MRFWVGLVMLAPKPGNDLLEGAAGAWVHVVGSGESEREFRRDLDDALAEFRFTLLELKDVWSAERIDDTSGVSEEICELVSRVEEDGYLRFGTFFPFTHPR